MRPDSFIHSILRLSRQQLTVLVLGTLSVLSPLSARADDSSAPQYAFGAGMERLPDWVGSSGHRNQAVPYIDINLPGYGELSTTDGLTVDFIDGAKLHGGFYGNYVWGRTHDRLGPQLGGIVDSLAPRIQAGGYLEYQVDHRLSIGGNLSHDTQGAGAYLNLYTNYDLPSIGYIEHSLELQWQGMNGPGMRRFFGVNPAQASALNTPTWRPGAGGEELSLEYDAFIPTSQHTGFALALSYGRLLGQAGNSPLVHDYGNRTQFSQSLAFVYHF